MNRRIFGILRHTVRAAVRSRIVAGMLILLGCVVTILPRTLRGDGTEAGDVRMLMTWTLGATVTLLAVATLWAGCSAMASEVEDRSLIGVVVTPIRAFELCLGKWLGLVVLNAALLAVVLGAISAQLALRGFPSSAWVPSQRLVPDRNAIEAHANQLLAQFQKQGSVPVGADVKALRAEILKRLIDEHMAVNPGESFRWVFIWPSHLANLSEDVRVQLDVLSSFGSAAGVEGTCIVRDARSHEIARFPMSSEDGRHVEHVIPASKLTTAGTLTVQLDNEAGSEGAAVLVRASDGAGLLVSRGSFVGNLLASGTVLLAVLSALAALGVAAGTMFSLPVAVFVASAVVVVGMLSRTDLESYEGCGHEHESAETCKNRTSPFSATLLRGVSWVVAPVAEADPLGRLGDRVRIEPDDVAKSAGIVGFLVPVLFAGLGSVVLRRREFG